LRGARDLNEAREYARAIAEPPTAARVDSPETLKRFRELLERDGDPRELVRELKAVGGDLRTLRLALTGAERGPELWTVIAAAPGASAELAENASRWYVEDTDELGLGRPDHEPKATESVPEIVAMIDELVAGGHAYAAGGDVYFRVSSFSDYGRLSGRHGDDEAMH